MKGIKGAFWVHTRGVNQGGGGVLCSEWYV